MNKYIVTCDGGSKQGYLCEDVDSKIDELASRVDEYKLVSETLDSMLVRNLKKRDDDIEVLKAEVSMFHAARKLDPEWPVGRVDSCACLGPRDGEEFCPCVIQAKAIEKIMGD